MNSGLTGADAIGGTPAQVSVVVPAHDAQRFLAEALASIWRNACVPLEVIVVDDGSNDDTVRVAQAFPVVCLRQEHRGVASARNRGWSMASGELLAWLDADDRWPDGRLERQLHELVDPNVDVVYGRVRQFSCRGSQVGAGTPLAAEREAAPAATARLPGTMLIRRAIFASVGGFDESLRVGEFMDWLVRAKARGVREKSIDAVCLERRLHDDNLGRSIPDRSDYLRVARRSLQLARGAKSE